MRVLKKLTVFIAATAAAALLIPWCVAGFGLRSPISALVINWVAVCWMATASLVIPLSFPPRYYDARPFEGTGRLYEHAGIRICRKFLRRGPLRILSPKLRLPSKLTIEALRELKNEMRKAETIHAFVFVGMLFVVGYVAFLGWIDAVLWMLLFNLLFNAYPIMLQRYNRIKLDELMRKPRWAS